MFKKRYAYILFPVILVGTAFDAVAREWTDSTGQYHVEADLIGFDTENVVLQRESGELGAIPIDRLSETDREYLQSKEALDLHDKNINQPQTWTTADGLKVVGRVVDFAKRSVTIERRRGKVYVNDRLFDNLPEIYQKILPKVIEHYEKVSIPDEHALTNWVRSLKGRPQTYELEGVIFELENGDEYGVPFLMFSEKDLAVLQPGWQAWLASVAKEDHAAQDDQAFLLQSLAAAYHQDQAINRQIAQLNLNLQAIQAGLVSAWEVTLYPGANNPYPPRWVVVTARNSEAARQLAMRQNPGFVSGPIRKVSR